MLGNRWFKPQEKTSYRKVWDRVSTLSLIEIGAYIRGAYKAHLNLVTPETYTEEENLKKELMELKMQLASGQLSQTHKIKETRRAIAQLKSVVREEKS